MDIHTQSKNELLSLSPSTKASQADAHSLPQVSVHEVVFSRLNLHFANIEPEEDFFPL